ncbi:MAG: arginine N-succinyltransferase [Deltaproteobacteria bacterium]|nr:arginine N-succinyltransferase [Deltaproteobacteria bacterium]
MTDNKDGRKQKKGGGFSGKQVIGMILASIFIAVLVTVLTIKIFLFPSPFKPVILTAKENQQLSTKLAQLDNLTAQPQKQSADKLTEDGTLKPERYSEEGNSREISFTEREVNALMAKNSDLADKVAVDLADNTVSIKLLIPLDPGFPVMGGKTLRVNAGAELAYRDGRPVVKLKGVSLMGVPMPNSWLGGLKNIDLIHEYGGSEGFWKAFADGVDSIAVTEGFLKIKLKE